MTDLETTALMLKPVRTQPETPHRSRGTEGRVLDRLTADAQVTRGRADAAAGQADAAAGRAAGLGAGVVARPELLGRLGAARVTVVSAPAGSGKTVLLRSWIGQPGLSGRAAWVPAERENRCPQRFWLAVLDTLRQTTQGSVLVQALSAAPDLDGWAVAERLLADLAPLAQPLWLVVDDVHELGPETLRQLELLIMRAPPQLRFVLAARHDVRLGLHRLRLEGELAELRVDDLRFTLSEAVELFTAAGAELPGPAVAVLHERTEGWAAGLRLAALAASGHPDPGRFAAGFSGAERTVAEYLLAEVLDRQPESVRRLLLRTSILDRVNGELADLLTGEADGERVLQDLASASAFTVPVDTDRSWYRYHQMFAGLLRLELRRTAPGEVDGLHRAAAGWFAAHGSPAEAVRQARAAGDWELAARLLADHWPGLYLDGQAAEVHELLAGFPAGLLMTDAELAVVAAADELAQGSLEAAERYLGLADRASASVPAGRRAKTKLLLALVRLLHARQRGNLKAVEEEAQRLQDAAGAPEEPRPHLGEDLRALALISLGSTEIWTTRYEEARQHLEQGVSLARRIGRPFLEFRGLADLAGAEIAGPAARPAETWRPLTRAAERARQAIELAERHGWTDEPAYGFACRTLGAALAWQGRPEGAEPWIEHGERTVTDEAEPATAVAVCYGRGTLELARGRDQDALAAFRAAERPAGRLDAPNLAVARARALQILVLVRLGDTEDAEQALAGLGDREREHGDVRMATSALRLAQDNPEAAAAALAPVLEGSASVFPGMWLALAFLLDGSIRDALGDQGAAGRALEHALDLAEPDGCLLPFLLHPAPGLLARHTRHRTANSSAHAALITDILAQLAPAPGQGRSGRPGPGGPGGYGEPGGPGGYEGAGSPSPGGPRGNGGTGSPSPGGPRGNGGTGSPSPGGYGGMASPHERGGLGGSSPRQAGQLSNSELRVLRYLPTNLTVPEIAGDLYLSINTVKTHIRNLYAKLGTHRRAEAVTRARNLGLLAPSARSARLPTAAPAGHQRYGSGRP